MKITKWLLSVFAVLIALSMCFSPASAQDELPPDFIETDENIGVDVEGPLPLSPIGVQPIYTKTPKFLFTPHSEASSYRIRVYNVFSDSVPLYTYEGSGNCTATICSLQPPNILKTYQYDYLIGGSYKWEVEAYDNGSWQNTSPQEYFTVYSKGFNSTFDVDTKKWMQWVGEWSRTSKGYYKTDGFAEYYSTAMQKELFFGNYVYEVKLKRKVETEPNWIIFNGGPAPLLANGAWSRANILEYSNSGTWRFLLVQSGVAQEIASGTSPLIVPYGWNTWTIWTNHPDIYIWVNGVLVAKVTAEVETIGYVGVGMYKSGSESSPLLVDYAKLYYSSIRPMEIENGFD